MSHHSAAAWMCLAAVIAQGAVKVEFEVASVKPFHIGDGRAHFDVDGARVDIGAASLTTLLGYAYGVKAYQVAVPASLKAANFNILAKIPEGLSKEQVPEMLQALLADRFKLVFHRESREIPVYALVVANGGPKLKEPVGEPESSESGLGLLPDGSGIAKTVLGDRVRLAAGSDGTLHVESPRMNMAALADMVQRFVDRPVIDVTALNGYFQIAFDTSLWGAQGPPPRSTAADPGPAEIFTSIQKLGLRLQARKAHVETIVVDSADIMPSAD